MPFYTSSQPWGRATNTVDDSYARLDPIAEKLQRDGAPPDYLELYVVDAVTLVLRTLADHQAFSVRAFCQACDRSVVPDKDQLEAHAPQPCPKRAPQLMLPIVFTHVPERWSPNG